MTDFAQLRELVERAAELGLSERAAYLEQACGGDDELRAEVEELLEGGREDSFLTPPLPGLASRVRGEGLATDVRAGERAGERTGERIGPFRVLRVIGRGGMGTVYEAEQDEPRRRVALKLLAGGGLSSESVRRFRHEAELLARLRHPGIAQVYSTGVYEDPTSGATPWFAMEYVEGARPLDVYANEEGLDMPSRLRLFVRICDAVQHGHAKGIVHRDLKPENLLVDADGHPKVIDFGVAATTEPDAATRLTLAGQILGTMAYMSPEQFSDSDVDTRSDVFSLGVCLYGLIAGRLPFDLRGKPLTSIAQTVRDTEPERLRDVPADLEAVCLHALEKSPDRRYPAASALAADLRRVLDHQPVEARPPTTAYYLWTFARRHRALVAAASIALLAILIGGAASLSFGLEAKRAEAETRELFDVLLERSSETTASVAEELLGLSGGAELGRRLVTGAVEDLENLAARAGDDPGVRERLALAWFRRGSFEARAAGLSSDAARAAIEHLDHAFDLARECLADAPDRLSLRALQASCRLERSQIEQGLFGLDASLASIEQAAEILEELRAADPSDAQVAVDLGYTWQARGMLRGMQGHHDEVEAPLRRAQELYGEAARLDPGDPGHRLRQSGTMLIIAASHLESDRLDRAVEEYTAVAELLDPLLAERPDFLPVREQLGRARVFGGDALARMQEPELAREWLFQAAEHYEVLVERDRFNVQHELSLLNVEHTLGRIERESGGDLDSARAWYGLALERLERLEAEGRLPSAYGDFAAELRRERDSL